MSNIGEKIKCRKCNGEGSYRSSFSPGLRRPPNIPCELCKGSGMEPLTSTEGNLEQAMNNETDLDWLARNVHVWDESAYAALCGGVERVLWISGAAYGQRSEFKNAVTKDQWLARRAELQGKPSFTDHPDAKCFVQQDDGEWFKNTTSCEVHPISDGGWREESKEYGWVKLGSGEVLGDWRDTLERRPVDLSEQAVTERLKEATDNVLAAVPELKSDKYKFQPFTSIEDNHNQEKVMKQDSGWFERGELPPVGTECEAATEGCKYEKCEILAFHKGQVALRWFEFNDGCLDVLELDGWSFRPIRTEREVAIEEMMETINVIEFVGTPHHLISEISAVMYDAGYRKEQK